jgi:antitoxin YefM
MTTISVTEARKSLFKLLVDTASSHEPIHITGKKGGAVLVSEDDWAAVQETLYLLSIPGMRESIRQGIATPVSKCSKELKW